MNTCFGQLFKRINTYSRVACINTSLYSTDNTALNPRNVDAARRMAERAARANEAHSPTHTCCASPRGRALQVTLRFGFTARNRPPRCMRTKSESAGCRVIVM